MKTIQEIIELKRRGIDCSENESAEIKGFIKEEIRSGKGIHDINPDIEQLFPSEFSEAYGEIENN